MEGALTNQFLYVDEGTVPSATLIGRNYVDNCFNNGTTLTASNATTDPAKTIWNLGRLVQEGSVVTDANGAAAIAFPMALSKRVRSGVLSGHYQRQHHNSLRHRGLWRHSEWGFGQGQEGHRWLCNPCCRVHHHLDRGRLLTQFAMTLACGMWCSSPR